MNFELYNKDTAPQGSKPLLDKSVKDYAMVPNLHAILAQSPATLEAYQTLHDLFQNTSFDEEELTVIWQSINVEHECHYCVAAHTGIAHSMKVDADLIDALRSRRDLTSRKLQVLHETTLALVRNRGWLNEAELEAFNSVGYGRQQLLEIILGISQKVISNYSNHQAQTPLDKPFQKFEWHAADNK